MTINQKARLCGLIWFGVGLVLSGLILDSNHRSDQSHLRMSLASVVILAIAISLMIGSYGLFRGKKWGWVVMRYALPPVTLLLVSWGALCVLEGPYVALGLLCFILIAGAIWTLSQNWTSIRN